MNFLAWVTFWLLKLYSTLHSSVTAYGTIRGRAERLSGLLCERWNHLQSAALVTLAGLPPFWIISVIFQINWTGLFLALVKGFCWYMVIVLIVHSWGWWVYLISVSKWNDQSKFYHHLQAAKKNHPHFDTKANHFWWWSSVVYWELIETNLATFIMSVMIVNHHTSSWHFDN